LVKIASNYDDEDSQYSKVNLERMSTPPITRDVAAKLDGLPPIMLLATMLSSMRWGNTVSYRSSGPIPTGLYRNVLNGTAAPKPFTQKVKSSNWGVMEGFAVVDDRLGRSEFSPHAGYSIRPHAATDLPKENGVVMLNKFPLKMALRDILQDTIANPPKPAKYELLKDNNPDKDGNLRFKEANHLNGKVNTVVFSINLKDIGAEAAPKDFNGLVAAQATAGSNPFEQPGYELPGWKKEWGNFAEILDSSFPCLAQFPDEPKPIPIEVYGEENVTVRDTDLDFITRPTRLDNLMPENDGYDKFFQTIDMSHGTPEEMLDASKLMIKLMFQINQSEWKKYNELRMQKVTELGDKFSEVDIADKMPLVPRFTSLSAIKNSAITVGLGSPMELYQAMEINLVNQKILNISKTNPSFKMDDLLDPIKRNTTLMTLAKEPLQLDDKARSKFFIQHPAECHNHHYTSDRGASVIIHNKSIALAKNDSEVVKYISSNSRGEYVPVNPQWLGEKKGANTHAADWAKHFITNFDAKRDVEPELNKAVHRYIEKHPEFVVKELKNFVGEQDKQDSVKSYLKANPEIQKMVSKASAIVNDKVAPAKEPPKGYELPPIRMRR
jgi:hypothetical protein